jgi:hypothetical protein
MEDVFALVDAIERAEDMWFELRHHNPEPQSDLARAAINLQMLIHIARQELARVQDAVLEELGRRIVKEERQTTPSAMFPAGTILSCPQCEEGLYKITTRASVHDIVLDDGTILQPLNATLPEREAWKALACPQCGGWCYKDGKLHTVQRGWW